MSVKSRAIVSRLCWTQALRIASRSASLPVVNAAASDSRVKCFPVSCSKIARQRSQKHVSPSGMCPARRTSSSIHRKSGSAPAMTW